MAPLCRANGDRFFYEIRKSGINQINLTNLLSIAITCPRGQRAIGIRQGPATWSAPKGMYDRRSAVGASICWIGAVAAGIHSCLLPAALLNIHRKLPAELGPTAVA